MRPDATRENPNVPDVPGAGSPVGRTANPYPSRWKKRALASVVIAVAAGLMFWWADPRTARVTPIHSAPTADSSDRATIPFPADMSLLAPEVAEQVQDAADRCRTDPTASAAFIALGRIYHANYESILAAASYERAISLGARDPQTHHLLGLIYAEQGDTERATAAFRRALNRDAGYAPTHYQLGRALLEAGRSDEAMDAIRQAIELDDKAAEFHTAMGQALRQAGRLAEAAVSLKSALALEPDHAGAHQLIGLTLRGLGRHDEAAGHLAKIRRYNSEVTRDPWLREVLKHTSTVEGLIAQARIYAEGGRPDSAITVLLRVAATHPNRADVFKELGLTYARASRSDQAAQAYLRAVELDPDLADAQAALGLIALERNQLSEAALRARLALQSDEACLDGRMVRAIVTLREGAPAEAARQLAAIVAERGDAVIAQVSLGDALLALRRFDEAVGPCERAVSLQPGWSYARKRLAWAYYYTRRFDDAWIQMKEAARTHPGDPELRSMEQALLQADPSLGDAIDAGSTPVNGPDSERSPS